MSMVKCPSCGSAIEMPEKKSGLPWLIGCLVALVAIPIVLGVIGMLAAIAIPSFVKARESAQMAACINNMRQIEAATEQWAMTVGAEADQPVDAEAVDKLMTTVPVCPAGGSYIYHKVGECPECSVHGLMLEP